MGYMEEWIARGSGEWEWFGERFWGGNGIYRILFRLSRKLKGSILHPDIGIRKAFDGNRRGISHAPTRDHGTQ